MPGFLVWSTLPLLPSRRLVEGTILMGLIPLSLRQLAFEARLAFSTFSPSVFDPFILNTLESLIWGSALVSCYKMLTLMIWEEGKITFSHEVLVNKSRISERSPFWVPVFLILPMELKLNLGFSVRHLFQMKMQLTLALTYIYMYIYMCIYMCIYISDLMIYISLFYHLMIYIYVYIYTYIYIRFNDMYTELPSWSSG